MVQINIEFRKTITNYTTLWVILRRQQYMSDKQKLTSKDFYYFSLPMNSSASNLKAVRFCLWLALGQIIVLPVYFTSQDATVLPITGPLMLVYLFLASVSFLSLITLFLFKITIYDALVYLVTGLFFLELSFLFIIIFYVEFFNAHNEMEIFNTINLNIIESKKTILINQLLLIPIVSTICGFLFHIYMIKTGKTNEDYKNAQKYKKNSKQYERIIPILFPIIFIFALFNSHSEIFKGGMMNLLFILGSIICSFFLPVPIIISYMKLKFPNEYSEKKKETKQL